jgi:hypothetical protein
VVLLTLVTKKNPTVHLVDLGRGVVQAITRRRVTVHGARAFVIGLLVWACIVWLVIVLLMFLYSLGGGS